MTSGAALSQPTQSETILTAVDSQSENLLDAREMLDALIVRYTDRASSWGMDPRAKADWNVKTTLDLVRASPRLEPLVQLSGREGAELIREIQERLAPGVYHKAEQVGIMTNGNAPEDLTDYLVQFIHTRNNIEW